MPDSLYAKGEKPYRRAFYLKNTFTNNYICYVFSHRNWQPIQSWEDETVKKLAYCSRTEDFSHNKVIVQSSKFNEFLWFVVKVSGRAGMNEEKHLLVIFTKSISYLQNTKRSGAVFTGADINSDFCRSRITC